MKGHKEVTLRKRVVTAISRTELDRVPIGFGHIAGAVVKSIPNGRMYSELCKYLGYGNRSEPIISPVANIVTNIDERILKEFGVDFRGIEPDMPPPRIEADGSKTWEIMCGYRITRVGLYEEPFPLPFKSWRSKKDIENYDWPNPDDFDIAKGKRKEARIMRETTDYAIVASSPFQLFPFYGYAQLCGVEKWLIEGIDGSPCK